MTFFIEQFHEHQKDTWELCTEANGIVDVHEVFDTEDEAQAALALANEPLESESRYWGQYAYACGHHN